MTTDSTEFVEEKTKLSQLVFNATEINGKVKGWKTIHEAVRNLLVIPTPHIAGNQEVQLAFAMLPLLTVPELSYPQLQAVVQKFRANAKPDKSMPVRAGLVDDAKKAQAPQANLVPVGLTTPTAKNHTSSGIILQDINMFSGKSLMPMTGPFCENWNATPSSRPQPIHGQTSPATEKMVIGGGPPIIPGNLHSHRSMAGSGALVSTALPALQESRTDGARKELSITHEKRKQGIESNSEVRDSDRAESVDLDRQEFGKRRRTSGSGETVAKRNIQRAAVPCGQCTLDDVECFKFVKPPRGRIRRACVHCNKKKRHCSFIPRPRNKELSLNMLHAAANHEENFSWIPNGPSSSRVKRESSQLGDVTTRVIKVEDMVMDLQDQFKTMQGKVVVMDTRIDDLFESTKSVARVMKGFETRSEQANRVIEKLVERVERL